MMKKLCTLLVISFFALNLQAQMAFSDTLEYNEYETLVKEYFNNQKFDSAIVLLKYGKDRFPEHRYESSQDLIYAYALARKNDKVLNEMQWGFDNNYWYGFDASWRVFDSIRDNKQFQELMAKNASLKEKAQQKARSRKLVQEPANYNPDSTYPLFIVLHGWGQNMKSFKEIWNSELLKEDFIVLYLQSSQLATMEGFGWQDSEKGYDEIVAAYHDVNSKYNIDTTAVIIGGFSQGGKMSIYATLEDSIPVKGFFALCPSVPENFEDEKIKKADEADKRGVLIVGGKDNIIQSQAAMFNTLKEIGFDTRYLVRAQMGHDIPEDLSDLLDTRTKYLY